MKWGAFFRLLSRRPRNAWPEGVLHHGTRILILVLLAAAVTAAFPVTLLPDFPVLERGMVPEEDLIAQVTFPVYKSPQELAREQDEAEAAVTPIFVLDPAAVDSMLAEVNRFFARVDSASAAAQQPEGLRRRLRNLVDAYGIPASDQDREVLLDPQLRLRLARTTRNAIRQELPRGFAVQADLEQAESQEVRLIGPDQDSTVAVDSLEIIQEFIARSDYYTPGGVPPGYERLQGLILARFVVPSIRPAPEATARQVAQARAQVPLEKYQVFQGERVVTARERVDEEDLERYQAYQQELQRQGLAGDGFWGGRTFGTFLFNLIVLSLLGALLFFYRPLAYRELRHVVVLSFLILAVTLTAAVIAAYESPIALIPIAFPALVVATLWDGRLALSMSLILAILMAGQTPFLGVVALLTLVAGGAVASLSVRVVRRRAQTWSFIALIAGAYVLAAVVSGLIRSWELGDIALASGWGGLNAIASAFAAMGFLPLFEGFTRITTDQTLLELADSNRPLLRRLSREAPGTYAHSINVANIAEAAAQAIGANALLTRVGVYYHDVGKIGRPHYFIENQPGHRNPHDKLKPATSAQVVRNHVLEGVKLAEEEKLPRCVLDFILEHHGTQPIGFFYDEACKADPDADIDVRDFAYPGPRPRTRETAIVMLADSVESATRALQDPTPDSLRELVDRIVRVKMEAGQLEEAPLTLKELATIKQEFVKILTGMYHQRIDYPASRGGSAETEAEPDPGAEEGRMSPKAAEDAAEKSPATAP